MAKFADAATYAATSDAVPHSWRRERRYRLERPEDASQAQLRRGRPAARNSGSAGHPPRASPQGRRHRGQPRQYRRYCRPSANRSLGRASRLPWLFRTSRFPSARSGRPLGTTLPTRAVLAQAPSTACSAIASCGSRSASPVGLRVAIVHLPLLNDAFSTTPLSPGDWAICAALASAVLRSDELCKLVMRQRDMT